MKKYLIILLALIVVILVGAYVYQTGKTEPPQTDFNFTPPATTTTSISSERGNRPAYSFRESLKENWGNYEIVYRSPDPQNEIALLVEKSTQRELYSMSQPNRGLFISDISRSPYIVLSEINCHYCSGVKTATIVINVQTGKSLRFDMADVVKIDFANDKLEIQKFEYDYNVPCDGEECPPAQVAKESFSQDLSALN